MPVRQGTAGAMAQRVVVVSKVAGRGGDPGIQHRHGVLSLSVVLGAARARKSVRRNGVSRLKLQHTSFGKRWTYCAERSKNLNRVRSNSVRIFKANFDFESDDRTSGGGLLRQRGVLSRRGDGSCDVVFFRVLIVYTHPKDVVWLNVEHDDNRQNW